MRDKELVQSVNDVACPFCGSRSYVRKMAFPECIDMKPIVINGVLSNRHTDGEKVFCYCNACAKDFEYRIKLKNVAVDESVPNKTDYVPQINEVVEFTKDAIKTGVPDSAIGITGDKPVVKSTPKKKTSKPKAVNDKPFAL